MRLLCTTKKTKRDTKKKCRKSSEVCDINLFVVPYRWPLARLFLSDTWIWSGPAITLSREFSKVPLGETPPFSNSKMIERQKDIHSGIIFL